MDTGAIVFIIFLVGAGVGILRCLHKKEKRKNQGKIWNHKEKIGKNRGVEALFRARNFCIFIFLQILLQK